MMSGTGREILGNVPGWLQAAMYVSMALSAGTAGWRVLRQARRWFRGMPEPKLLPLSDRLRDLGRRALVQRDLAEADRLAGVMHRMIFWGFAVLFLATVLTAVDHDLGMPLLRGPFYLFFAFTVDLFGVLFVAGVAMAIYRRWALRPPKLAYGRRGDAAAAGALLAAGLTGFWLEGARIALDGWPAHERLSFGGWMSGLLLAAVVEPGGWAAAHRALWGVHVAAVAALFAALPFTRLLHLLATPLNILVRARAPGGLRTHGDPAGGGSAAAPEATLDAFTWKQLLELDACTSCGRCSAVCPATASGKPLSPMLVIQHLRERMNGERGEADLIGGVVHPDELWSCTTCGACEQACPVAVNHIDRIVDLRRALVDGGVVQATAARAMEAMLSKGNPWEYSPGERGRWAERLGVRVLREGESCETLYWVGCAGAFDEQARKIAEAVALLLKRAGVEFAVLGPRERCSGDMARRIGEEGLFRELARQNAATIRSHGVRRIVTHCPHCWNTFAKEYELPGVEIVHHADLLRRLVSEGRLAPARAVERRVVFHDPCYLGRYNGVFAAPREVIAALRGARASEMPRARERSFCCGGGGGQVVLDIKAGERIPNLRFAEAEGTGAEVIATACPFCKIMLAPAAVERGAEGKIAVKDVAELLAEACA